MQLSFPTPTTYHLLLVWSQRIALKWPADGRRHQSDALMDTLKGRAASAATVVSLRAAL